MKEELNKKDILWGYASKLLSIGSGIITLPLILNTLQENEIAYNYILLSIMAMVTLFDFGFSPQFARNFSFIYAGAQEITKIGIPEKKRETINYQLLYQLIQSAKLLYLVLAFVLFFVLSTIGSFYIYQFTNGFTVIDNSFSIWIFFCISVFIDFYYRFYTPLLLGAGFLLQANKIEVYASIIRIISLIFLILNGLGLWAVIISYFVKIFVVRFFSYKTFYTKKIDIEFSKYKGLKFNRVEIIQVLWHNAKRKLIVSIATFAATQLSTLLAGLFLSKSDVASYGLLVQLVGIISTLSLTIDVYMTPIYPSLRAQNKYKQIYSNLYFSIGVFILLSIIGSIFLLVFIPEILRLIKSNTSLPSLSICIIYLIYKILENQHCICSSYLTSQNKIVDFESATIIGIANVIFQWIILSHTTLGLWGLVFIQAIIPLCYPNWKWPYEVCKELKVSYTQLIKNSINETLHKTILR